MLDRYIQILVSKGHKVAVIEQTETTRQADARLGSENRPKMNGRWCAQKTTKDQVVKREVLATYTKGTFVANSNYEPNYVMGIRKQDSEIAVCYFDVSTHACFLG